VSVSPWPHHGQFFNSRIVFSSAIYTPPSENSLEPIQEALPPAWDLNIDLRHLELRQPSGESPTMVGIPDHVVFLLFLLRPVAAPFLVTL